MQAVVLAVGKGTRLQPLTDDKLKILVEVNGMPLIKDVFDNLVDSGATELIVVIGYKAGQIMIATATRTVTNDTASGVGTENGEGAGNTLFDL